MAAQVELQTGEVGRTGLGGRLHLSPLTDSSNKSLIEGPSSTSGTLIITPEPNKPVPAPKPRLTPKPFAVEKNPTIRPILAPKPQAKPRPEPTQPTGYKPDPPSAPQKPQTPNVTSKPRPVSTNPSRPAPTSFKPSPKLNTGQTTKPVAQPFKAAPPLSLEDPSKPSPPQPVARQKPGPGVLSYSRSSKKPLAAEWSGTTKKEEEQVKAVSGHRSVGPSMTRAKSMGFLSQIGQEEEKGPEVTLRPQSKGTRPRPVSAIFLPSPTQTESPAAAARWAGRRPLSADLTSRFESVGLSLHRKPQKADSKENTPEDRAFLRRREKSLDGIVTTAQGADGTAKPTVADQKSEKKKDGNEEEKGGGSIKRRISLLLDSSSSPGAGVTSQGSEPRSPTTQIPEDKPPLGIKQRIKKLTEDTPPAQTPFVKPTLKPRPLPLDLTKRFTPERSTDLCSPSYSETADYPESDGDHHRRGEESPANFGDHGNVEEDKRGPLEHPTLPSPDPVSRGPKVRQTAESTSNESGPDGTVQTVRASLFENVVERHSVLVLDEDQPKDESVTLPRSLKRGEQQQEEQEEEDSGSLVTATYRRPASPSGPRRAAHSFDTVQAVEESKAVSESLPSACLEDKAMTLRSRRSEGTKPGRSADPAAERPSPAQGDPGLATTPEQLPRYLRIGALPKWNAADVDQGVETEKGRRRELERERLAASENERERQREAEREEVAAPKRLKMLEADEQPKPRATYFALTGQIQEPTSPVEAGAEMGDMTVPLDDFSMRSGQWGSQGKVLPLRRNPSLEEAFGKGPQSPNQGEALMEKSYIGRAETEEMEVEKQRELRRETEIQKDRKKELEREKLRQIEIERQKHLEFARMKERERQREFERQRQKEFEKEKQELERQKELERQRELDRERQRQREKERQRELERERQREMERERQREMERERQREMERERQRELEKEGQLEKERQRELEKERQREQERQRVLDKERQQLEVQRERQQLEELERIKEMERRQLFEFERQKQAERERQQLMELEKHRLREKTEREEAEKMRQMALQMEVERQRELERERERQRETERERVKELERERQRELERRRQRDLERERQKQLDFERQELENQKLRQQEQHKERQRAEELERAKEAERRLLVEFEKQKQQQVELEKQRLREKMEREEAERMRQVAKQQEAERMRQVAKQQEAERMRQVAKQQEVEKMRQVAKQQEAEKMRQVAKQQEVEKMRQVAKQQEVEKMRQVAKQQEAEKMRQVAKQQEAEKMRQVAKQQEAERQRVKEKQRREEQERVALDSSPLRPKVLDLDSVLRDDPFSKGSLHHGDPATRWKQPSPRAEEPYRPAILDIDSFTSQTQPSPPKETFPVAGIQGVDVGSGARAHPLTPERDGGRRMAPEGSMGRPSPVWAPFHQDVWSGEMTVDRPVAGPDPARKPASKPSLEQLLLRQEERILAPSLVPEKRWSGVPDVANMATSPGRVPSSTPMDQTRVPMEAEPQGHRVDPRSHRRSHGSQELSRMRSRSVSRRSTPSESTVEGSLSRMRSRSAHRERDHQSWVQQKQGVTGEDETKDTDTLVHETDSQYGTWDTGLRTDDSLTPATPTSDGILSPSPRKLSPPHTPGDHASSTDPDSTDGHSPSSPPETLSLPFPEAPTTLLDTSALRSRAQLAKKRAPRSRPSRAARLAAPPEDQAGAPEDWLYRDSTEEKVESKQESDSEEQAKGGDPHSTVSSSQPQRVPIFPGMDPSALKAQLKKRGDSEVDGLAPSPSQLSRSPKSPFLPRAARVLPTSAGKENGGEDSPQWLRELKSKKRLSQYENDS